MNKVGGALPSRFWVVSISMAFFLCMPLPRVFAQVEASSTEEKKASVPIQVHGDSVEYFHEEQKVTGTGHVSIDYEGGAGKIFFRKENQGGIQRRHHVGHGDRADGLAFDP